MPISTNSSFTYGHTIDSDNENINFMENGVDELTATIENGSYYLNEFIDKVAEAMNEIGDNTYSVTLDRTTRKITISADANFDLLVTTGSQVSISAFPLIGFTTDRSGVATYEADNASGSIYTTQAPLRGYISFDDIQESVESKVNESSSGEIEVVSFGVKNLMEGNIKYVTNITGQNYIRDNATGVADLRTFMQYAVTKAPMEFIPDQSDNTTYTPCILESTSRGRDGTSFLLRELYSEKLANYFETGKLVFRKIN